MKKSININKKESLSDSVKRLEDKFLSIMKEDIVANNLECPVYFMKERMRLEDELAGLAKKEEEENRKLRYAPTSENIERIERDIISLDLHIRDLQRSAVYATTCRECRGSGFVRSWFKDSRCPKCFGAGRERED